MEYNSLKLPNFLIIGSMRSGTTTLYNYLRQHPDIFLPTRKETNIFTYLPSNKRNLSDYSSRFSLWSGEKALGEASPHYMYYPHIIPLIAKYIPHCKLIIILRNPINRAYSHYWYTTKTGREWLNFKRALDLEEIRISKYMKTATKQPSWFYSYQDMGRYDIQVARVMQHFDKNQILVIQFRDLIKKPRATLCDIFDFLEVNSAFKIKLISHNDPQANSTKIPKNLLLMRILAYMRMNFDDKRFLLPFTLLFKKLASSNSS